MAALALGAGVTWNITNVGAVADPLATAYGSSLATIGLFTTALFVTHLLAQVPAGRAADRAGARRVGLISVAAVVAGNLLALAAPEPGLALAARALVGIGSGAGFVAGAEYMRAARASPLFQGVYGGATMAGGGLAIAVVPQLDGALGWRGPYWSALAVALACAVVLLAAPADTGSVRHDGPRGSVLRDRRLYPLGALHAASFGLSVIAGNWVVTLLERQGHSRAAAGLAGSLVLLAGIVTRPLGGLLARRAPERARTFVGLTLVAAGAGTLTLAAAPPLAVSTLAAAVLGLAVGLPFAFVFGAAQRTRPDAPAAGVGVVNGLAVLTIVVGTPLAGLAFELPGDGRLAFAGIGALSLAALAALARARTL